MRYHIPASFVADYHGADIVVRAHDPSDFAKYLSDADIERVRYLQLCSLRGDTDCLAQWGERIPLDLVMTDPGAEFSLLYRFAPLLIRRPVRVSVPPVSGIGKAVKLAASLNFAVKITGGQPAAALRGEMTEILNLYLRHPTVSQPIEYFHSVFLAFFHEKPISLLTIQEEDPASLRYITDHKQEAMSARFAAHGVVGEAASADLMRSLPEASEECPGCEFLPQCRGYFKWPERDYSCELVRGIFRTLKNAAEELKKDSVACLETAREDQA